MDANTINRTTDLAALVPDLRRRGRYFTGPCPFCGGDDRFTVKRLEDGDVWLCRKCGQGKYEDAVAFLMRREGKTFGEVTSGEGRGAGGGQRVPPPAGRGEQVARGGVFLLPPDEEWQMAALVAGHAAAEALNKEEWVYAQQAWHYLRAYRGLSPETIRRAMLGFNRDWLVVGGNYLAPGIYIPGMVDGQLWYLKSRIASSVRRTKKMGKYMALAGSRCAALYNGDALAVATTAVVVEGEFDALLLGQFLPPGWAAVTMGSAGSLPGPAFQGYFSGVERILLRMDADAAGQAGLAAWRALFGRAELLPPLPGNAHDITAFWQEGGDVAGWVGGGVVSG